MLLILFIQHQDVTHSLIWVAQSKQHFLNINLWILSFTDFLQLRFVYVSSRLQTVVADLPFIHILLFRFCLIIIVFLLTGLFLILDQWVRIAIFHLLPTLFFLILISLFTLFLLILMLIFTLLLFTLFMFLIFRPALHFSNLISLRKICGCCPYVEVFHILFRTSYNKVSMFIAKLCHLTAHLSKHPSLWPWPHWIVDPPFLQEPILPASVKSWVPPRNCSFANLKW